MSFPFSCSDTTCSHTTYNHTTYIPIFHTALDRLPSGRHLDHIEEFGHTQLMPAITGADTFGTSLTSTASLAPMLFSSGLPPVPAKLAKRIQDGLFVEMSVLLPEKLISVQYSVGEVVPSQKQKHYEVTTIIEWVQCFVTYITIVSQKEPEWTADLLGYQQLIIHSSQHCQEGRWPLYDRHFRLKASATRSKDWSTIEINIWNLAFNERTTPMTSGHLPYHTGPGTQPYSSNQPPPADRKICLEWNDNPSPNCPYPDCRFEHCCYRCIFNPKVVDNKHKALFCPHKGKRCREPLLAPPCK